MWRESNDWRGAGDVTIRPLLGLPGICGGRIIPRWARGQHAPPPALLPPRPLPRCRCASQPLLRRGARTGPPTPSRTSPASSIRHLGRVQDLPPLREGEGDTRLFPIHPDRRAVQVVRRALRRVWSRRLRLLRRGRRYRRWPTSHGPHRGYGRPQEEPDTRCETPTGDRWRERRQKGRSAVGQPPSKGRPD